MCAPRPRHVTLCKPARKTLSRLQGLCAGGMLVGDASNDGGSTWKLLEDNLTVMMMDLEVV